MQQSVTTKVNGAAAENENPTGDVGEAPSENGNATLDYKAMLKILQQNATEWTKQYNERRDEARYCKNLKSVDGQLTCAAVETQVAEYARQFVSAAAANAKMTAGYELSAKLKHKIQQKEREIEQLTASSDLWLRYLNSPEALALTKVKVEKQLEKARQPEPSVDSVELEEGELNETAEDPKVAGQQAEDRKEGETADTNEEDAVPAANEEAEPAGEPDGQ